MKTFNEMYPNIPAEDTVEAPAIGVKEILNMFSNKEKCPCENEIKALAAAHEMDYELIEEIAFRLLHSIMGFGASNERGYTSRQIEMQCDKEQLERGIEVEYEHTNNYYIAKKIALDHLAELPDYYTRLDRMERAGRIELGLPEEVDEQYE